MNILKPYTIKLAPTLSGHWYEVRLEDEVLGYYPSSTTILNAYPQSPQLTKWIAEKGWQESQRIKSDAGARGTSVHTAVEELLNGVELNKVMFALEEWNKINSFVEWYKAYKPEIISLEMPVFSLKYGYAGRTDCIAKIGTKIYVIDWKTSSAIHPNFWLQFASYAQAIEEMTDIKIDCVAGLQLGARNKHHYRFAVEGDWRPMVDVFCAVKKTWEYDYGRQAFDPPILDLPASLKL